VVSPFSITIPERSRQVPVIDFEFRFDAASLVAAPHDSRVMLSSINGIFSCVVLLFVCCYTACAEIQVWGFEKV
jgi:hypothetical protein